MALCREPLIDNCTHSFQYMTDVLTKRGEPFLPFFEAVKNLVPGQPVGHENLRQVVTQIHFPAIRRR